MSLCRPEVFAGVPDTLPPAGPGDLAVAPGIWAPWRRIGLRRGPGDCGSEEEVEAKPEEEEGVQLRGETAAAAEQLRGGLVFVPDHSVATTPPSVHLYKTLMCYMFCSIYSFYTSDAGCVFFLNIVLTKPLRHKMVFDSHPTVVHLVLNIHCEFDV